MKRLAVLACAVTCTVQAETISWLDADSPPCTIVSGAFANQGYCDAAGQYARAALPQYQHRVNVIPLKRLMLMVHESGVHCMSSLLRNPERETFLQFTQPVGYILPNGIVVRGDDSKRFEKFLTPSGLIRLEQLVADPNMRLGVTGGRIYGPLIDSVIQPLLDKQSAQVDLVTAVNARELSVLMLLKKRFDYFPSDLPQAFYFSPSPNALQFYRIAGASALVPDALSCSRNNATELIFNDIEKVIDPEIRARFQAAYERWLPTAVIPVYRKLVLEQEAALRGDHPPPTADE